MNDPEIRPPSIELWPLYRGFTVFQSRTKLWSFKRNWGGHGLGMNDTSLKTSRSRACTKCLGRQERFRSPMPLSLFSSCLFTKPNQGTCPSWQLCTSQAHTTMHHADSPHPPPPPPPPHFIGVKSLYVIILCRCTIVTPCVHAQQGLCIRFGVGRTKSVLKIFTQLHVLNEK